MTKFAINAAIAASLTFAAVAPAAPAAAATAAVQVRYADLDLASAAGTRTLAQRVDATCERPDIRELKSVSTWEQCKDTARNSAMEQLNSKGVAFDSAVFIAG
jgi:UrcA family protein